MRSDSFDSYDQHYGRGLLKDTVKDGTWLFRHVFRKYAFGSIITLANVHFWLMFKVKGKYLEVPSSRTKRAGGMLKMQLSC